MLNYLCNFLGNLCKTDNSCRHNLYNCYCSLLYSKYNHHGMNRNRCCNIHIDNLFCNQNLVFLHVQWKAQITLRYLQL